MKNVFGSIAAIAALAVLAGCQPIDQQPPSAAVQAGKLGNGGFLFRCDDSVACGHWYSAKVFPDAVAAGAKFALHYYPKEKFDTLIVSEGVITQQDDTYGVTLSAVGDFLSSSGSAGGTFTAVRPGKATVMARRADGALVEFSGITIQKADGLAVYDTAANRDHVRTIPLKKGETKDLRAIAQRQGVDLAGELTYQWSGSDPNIADLDTRDNNGAVTITGVNEGQTSFDVTGGSLTQSIKVEVTK